jgi:uncharacterized Zn finger protein
LFTDLGLSLFPAQLPDIALECSCQSWQKPCGHLAATCYALAESFDADPFGILAWRGRGREELLERLRSLRIADLGLPAAKNEPASTASFWAAGPRLEPLPPPVPGTVQRPDALLEALEPLELTAGRFDVIDLLRGAYRVFAVDVSNAQP